ncbi:MAG: GNAT family N-acetyltransferase [Methanomassiliicoccales archaeon]|nr:MAG: GNAT family N-acetyltransferase [Methanomassiliicoccales archaeon]
MEVRIREAQKDDYPIIYDCMTETAWKDVPEEEKVISERSLWEQFFRGIAKPLIERPGRKIFIAYDDQNDIMGYVITGGMGEESSVIPVGMIFDICVLEQFRKRGIAKMLIEVAEEYCRQQGIWRIKLEVAANNPVAIDLYRKAGFKDERTLMGKNLS